MPGLVVWAGGVLVDCIGVTFPFLSGMSLALVPPAPPAVSVQWVYDSSVYRMKVRTTNAFVAYSARGVVWLG